MSFTHKIDEWMKEAETRPESAVTIVKLVARRLRELTERNEELLTENIALQNGTRVEEYQKRIAHLEYQLDLLKRRFGADDSLLAELPATSMETSTLNLLIYNTYGRIFRLELPANIQSLGRIAEDTLQDTSRAVVRNGDGLWLAQGIIWHDYSEYNQGKENWLFSPPPATCTCDSLFGS